MNAQLAFDLGHRCAVGREDFLLSECNADAIGWVDRWPQWTAPALILHGPAASGKSHLAAVWAQASGAAYLPPENLSSGDANDLFARGRHFVLDHLDPWIGDRAAETTLFHLYNMAKERGATILITMRTPPKRHEFSLPDLASRLRAAPAAAIQPPDDTLLAALLVKLFSDRQLQVGEDVVTYILPRMERSFAAARDIVERIDAEALSERRNISVPLARGVLARMADGHQD